MNILCARKEFLYKVSDHVLKKQQYLQLSTIQTLSSSSAAAMTRSKVCVTLYQLEEDEDKGEDDGDPNDENVSSRYHTSVFQSARIFSINYHTIPTRSL